MMGFPEIGFVLRLIFIFQFNIKRINQAHKINPDKESMNDFWVGLIFVVVIVIVSFLNYFIE